jgi:hypothetical protein
MKITDKTNEIVNSWNSLLLPVLEHVDLTAED